MWQLIKYQPSDLRECVNSLHSLVCECPNGLLAIKEKYSQHKVRVPYKKIIVSHTERKGDQGSIVAIMVNNVLLKFQCVI